MHTMSHSARLVLGPITVVFANPWRHLLPRWSTDLLERPASEQQCVDEARVGVGEPLLTVGQLEGRIEEGSPSETRLPDLPRALQHACDVQPGQHATQLGEGRTVLAEVVPSTLGRM